MFSRFTAALVSNVYEYECARVRDCGQSIPRFPREIERLNERERETERESHVQPHPAGVITRPHSDGRLSIDYSYLNEENICPSKINEIASDVDAC